MTITLQSPQCFAIGMVIFGLIGFIQGGRRAVVLTAFTVSAILFLSFFGANGIASFIFVRLPETLNTLTGGAIFSSSMPPPSAQQVVFSALLALVVAMALGFIVGGAAFRPIESGKWSTAAHTSARFLGLISGLVTGFAVINYLGRLFAANTTFSLSVVPPGATNYGSYILLLVGIAIVSIVLYWLVKQYGSK